MAILSDPQGLAEPAATVPQAEPASITIPVIDISRYLDGDAAATASIAASISTAAQSPGFLQITGHSIPTELIDRVRQQIAAFFALPIETKRAIYRNKSRALRGYEAVGEQQLEKGFADAKEGLMIGREQEESERFMQGPNQWPDEDANPSVKGFRETMMEYFGEMLKLSKVMFRLVALSLDLDEKYFDEFVGSENSIQMCRAHRYPPTTKEQSIKSRGIGAHTDFGALTLLLQDQIGGLEVFHRPTETWHPVRPIDGAYVVNIGDMLERWTNDRYTSTLHRVISPVNNEYRYSIAFFNEGRLDEIIKCIPTCLKDGDEPKHEPVQVEAHLKKRYGQSY